MSNFVKAALTRALRTFCQTAVATIGTTALISEVDWMTVLSTAGLAAILSILTSIATGLPECESKALPDAETDDDGEDE